MTDLYDWAIALGTPIFNLVDQPGDCGANCPCEVGPSDAAAYSMHWTADGGDA